MKTDKVIFTDIKNNTDYSGLDLSGFQFKQPISLSHGFFNGVTADNCDFISVLMDQSEFAEALFSKCLFKSINLTGSDFVSAQFIDVEFSDCYFTHGEWRDSKFSRVKFTRCSFEYTTINLCAFDDCSFCSETTKWLDHNAVNYNVFTGCTFDSAIQDTAVLSKNFALPGYGINTALVPGGAKVSLEEVCLASAYGRISVINFVNAIENEFTTISRTRIKRLRLEFVSNIISSLAREGSISSSSMIYVENMFMNLAQSVTNEKDFRTVMSAIINIRNALFESAMDLNDKLQEYDAYYCSNITIRYDQTFNRYDAEDLAEGLALIAARDSSALSVSEVRHGSTTIEIAVISIVSVTSLVTAVNYLLGQAIVTINKLNDLKEAVYKFNKPALTRTNKPKTPRTKKVAAIMRSEGVLPEHKSVREVVSIKGKQIVQFDEKAEVSIQVAQE